MNAFKNVKEIPQEVQNQIIDDYNAFLSYNKIAEKYSITRKLVENIIGKNGVKKHGKQLKRLSEIEVKQFIELYKNGVKVEELCKKFDTTYYILKQVARENGFSLRGKGPQPKKRDMDLISKFIEHWKNGISQELIAAEYNVTQDFVSKMIRKFMPENEYKNCSKYNRKITKGRIIHDAGYVMLRLEKSDPFFDMVNGNGYVMEHRYIMAKKLGRCLLPSEQVHHKDGSRLNNCEDNLQLRIGNHGVGVCYKCSKCGSTELEPIEI